MLRRQRQLETSVQKLADAMLFGVAFWLAHWLRGLPMLDQGDLIQDFSHYAWLLLLIVPLTPPVLELGGYYNRPLRFSRADTVWQLLRAALWMSLLVITALYFRKTEGARGVLILFPPVAVALALAKEEIVRAWTITRFGRQATRRRVIILGSRGASTGDSERFEKAVDFGGLRQFDVVARLDIGQLTGNQLAEVLHETSANAVIISPRHALFGTIEQAIQVCELEGVEVWLLADFFQTRLSRASADDLQGSPVLVFRTGPDASWQALAKSVLDFAGSFVLLLAFSPVLIAVAMMVRFSSPGPVFFRQQRAGLNGRPFTMLKFRTMVTNAEQLKQELEQLNEMSGPVFKVTNDPRVTPLGRWLRKWSLDELPQLWNVFRGEMSLVGPRPLPVDEVKRFDDPAHRRRLSVKPGLTCLWQISGRNNVRDFQEWVRLDLEYIDNWSLWLDVKILVRTIPAVMAGTGAK